jgi:hypothetical protein
MAWLLVVILLLMNTTRSTTKISMYGIVTGRLIWITREINSVILQLDDGLTLLVFVSPVSDYIDQKYRRDCIMSEFIRKQPSGCRWHKHYYYLFNSDPYEAGQLHTKVVTWLNDNIKGRGVVFHRAQTEWALYVNSKKRRKSKYSWFVSTPPYGERFFDFMVYFKKRRHAKLFEDVFVS